MLLIIWFSQVERQLNFEEPTLEMFELYLGIPIPLPLTTVKLLVSILKAGFVDRILNL